MSPLGGTVARVCGGWVRDKLLGLESHDVDVTINNMTGAHFAELVRQVQATRGVEPTANLGASPAPLRRGVSFANETWAPQAVALSKSSTPTRTPSSRP